jgi:hypothetical protein
MKSEEIQNKLIEILLKKAEGYYYYEEQEDYEKTQIKQKYTNKQYENVSMFENLVTEQSNSKHSNDKINLSNGNEEQDNKDLTLVKKKITKHYIPPDMLAIKILFEINKEKVNENDLNNLTDDELLKLKDKLLGELLNEN